MNWLRRRRAPVTGEMLIEEQAVTQLVARHPTDFLYLGALELNSIPNGGSIFPWRYRRQVETALDNAEHRLIDLHPVEYAQLCDHYEDVAKIRSLNPEDFLP